ncbi:MAG: hypothetical protein HY581_11780 [Nitrospirae bacterium]|nr:hypothetical protein [Nitrospirota bacterium]
MRLHGKGWAFIAAVALVVGVTSTALAIEAFQERFEWGDLSKPTTLTGRVIILDPYDEAVWINIAVLGGNAESGYFWQKIHPGKNLKFYAANKQVWDELKTMARPHAGPAAAKEVPPASATTLIEFVAQETEQNHRVISSVKKLPEIAGAPDKPRSIRALMTKECQESSSEYDKKCYEAKKRLNTTPKGRDTVMMQYDVMLPGGKVLASGLTPWSANEDTLGGGH